MPPTLLRAFVCDSFLRRRPRAEARAEPKEQECPVNGRGYFGALDPPAFRNRSKRGCGLNHEDRKHFLSVL